MQTTPLQKSIAAAQTEFCYTRSSLEKTEAFASHFATICEAIDILKKDAFMVVALARVGKQLADDLKRIDTTALDALNDGINMLSEFAAEYEQGPDHRSLSECPTSLDEFFRDLEHGNTAYPVCPCDAQQLYTAYVRWCQAEKRKPRSRNALVTHAHRENGWALVLRSRYTDLSGERVEKLARMVLPPPIVLESASVGGADFRRSRFSDEAEWATAGYLAFAAALERAA